MFGSFAEKIVSHVLARLVLEGEYPSSKQHISEKGFLGGSQKAFFILIRLVPPPEGVFRGFWQWVSGRGLSAIDPCRVAGEPAGCFVAGIKSCTRQFPFGPVGFDVDLGKTDGTPAGG